MVAWELPFKINPNRQTDKQTNGYTDKRTHRQTDRQTNGHTDKHTNRQTNRQTDRQNGQTDKRTNGQTDKRTNGQTNKQTNKQTDRQAEKSFVFMYFSFNLKVWTSLIHYHFFVYFCFYTYLHYALMKPFFYIYVLCLMPKHEIRSLLIFKAKYIEMNSIKCFFFLQKLTFDIRKIQLLVTIGFSSSS